MILFTKFRFNKYIAITIYPFIIINKDFKDDEVLLNHEKIHIKQQKELLWFPFFIWYFLEFFMRYIQYRNWLKAYQNISFERESHRNEYNPNYIKHRKKYAFIKYL
jgi:hypothetical protein